ncbi:Uncharacterised protein [Klebsiella pneumoniae]|nr:Uncharacterised protein [Klebsiella pneumoniae]VGH41625.1 Uncharacterised protein [Klebsiella pneumoniae]VGI76586.1 Uncharacterised protein [Klebsiella pneumoniae]
MSDLKVVPFQKPSHHSLDNDQVLWSNLNGHFDRVFSPRQGT